MLHIVQAVPRVRWTKTKINSTQFRTEVEFHRRHTERSESTMRNTNVDWHSLDTDMQMTKSCRRILNWFTCAMCLHGSPAVWFRIVMEYFDGRLDAMRTVQKQNETKHNRSAFCSLLHSFQCFFSLLFANDYASVGLSGFLKKCAPDAAGILEFWLSRDFQT